MRKIKLTSLFAAVLLVTVALPLPSEAAAGFGVFSTKCAFTHANNDDPIVYPGQPGAAHRHHYFGNASTDYATTTASLEAGTTNCDRPEDLSAYWLPALYNNGVELPFSAAHVYYRTAVVNDKTATVPLPSGLRMVAGTSAHPEPPPGFRTAEWACVGAERVVSDDFPTTCPSQRIIATITFPTCWDGVQLTTSDQSHMAYLWENPDSPRVCPPSHPVLLPEITEWFRWSPETTDMRGLTLSSGNGDTLHGDFWNAWDEETLARLVNKCLVRGAICGTIGQ